MLLRVTGLRLLRRVRGIEEVLVLKVQSLLLTIHDHCHYFIHMLLYLEVIKVHNVFVTVYLILTDYLHLYSVTMHFSEILEWFNYSQLFLLNYI